MPPFLRVWSPRGDSNPPTCRLQIGCATTAPLGLILGANARVVNFEGRRFRVQGAGIALPPMAGNDSDAKSETGLRPAAVIRGDFEPDSNPGTCLVADASHDFGKRKPVLDGEGSAVFVFRRYPGHIAVHALYLDPGRAE